MLKLRNGWPQTPPFGTMICTLSSVTSSVQNSDNSLTVPTLLPTCTLWPTLKGRKISSMMPAARLESVPCKASPTARLAAPMTATRLVVWMPNCDSTASRVTVRIR